MNFEFTTAQRILFGTGMAGELGKLSRQFGQRALLVSGSGSVSLERILENLAAEGLSYTQFKVAHEPDIKTIKSGVEAGRQIKAELIIGIGGGSVLDSAKAIGALLTNPGDIYDYLEVVGQGRPLSRPSIPVIAVPTTAGTGAEVTRNSVIAVPEKQVKVSLRSPYLLPEIALVDPEMTYSSPPSVTAGSGLDALTQNIEAYTSLMHNPIIDSIAFKGTQLAARGLRPAFIDGSNTQAREDMALASLFGGISLANAGLGAVHGFAGVLGGMFDAPHGAVCGRLLPGVIKANLEAFLSTDKESPFLDRYREIASAITGDPVASLEEGIEWIEETLNCFQIRNLREYGISEEQFPEIITKAQASSSMKKNPILLSKETLLSILAEAY